MTFVEAAIEILKREGKPLSSRRLAELAVKHNLLSVVGRDPESTMQERLSDALEQTGRHPDLLRVTDDTFGLHVYPPQPYPPNGAQAHAAEAPAEEKRPRRRRGRRADDAEGGDETAAAGADEGADGEGAEAEAAAGDAATGEAAAGEVAAGDATAGEAAPAGEKRRRRRRGGRGRRRREGGEAAPATAAGEAHETDEEAATDAPAVPDELPLEAAAAGTPPEDVAELEGAGEEAELLDESGVGAEAEELVDEDIDEHTGPLLAPALGAEDVTRTEDDRTVRPEILGSRDDRRHHRGQKDRRDRHRKGEHKAHEHKGEHRPHEHKPHEAKPHEGRHEHKGEHKAHEHKAHEAKPHEHRHEYEHRQEHEHRHELEHRHERAPAEPRTGGLIDALLDVLRASDGRPMHVRHLVDTAVKRRALDDKTPAADLVRLARAALVREQREREADGLRPRVRAVGGGHYGTVDKKLDPELLHAERELGASAGKLRDATRAAVRRRLGRMAPAAFDALGRTLADKLGVTGLELLRRGEGVTYWGGTWPRGVATARVLIALRPGEGEVNRRAVGELRAGLAAKGYDEGLLFAAGRPNAEALAELKQGGVTLYDGAALAALVVKHGLGVRRVAMPVDYLDLDFFGELNEG